MPRERMKMLRKLNRSFRRLSKFIFFGSLRRKTSTQITSLPQLPINYYMTSVFPDKETKDEILNTIQMYEQQQETI